ncbi:MAG: hypothetical protein PF637_00155 [Spirochaetes bacterium]|jgi:hypothetical protein|nr:hypothetical protein [Spirochaetota bacterium]
MNTYKKILYLFNNTVDYDVVVHNCKKAGIDAIITNDFVFAEKEFQEAMRVNSIPVVYNFPVFCDTGYLDRNPQSYSITATGKRATGTEWLHFVCPSDSAFMEYQQNNLISILKTYNPETLTLDFIRFYVFWEMVSPDTQPVAIEDGCYCDRCLVNFEATTGVHIKEKSKKWIYTNIRKEWAAWKTHHIEKTVDMLTQIIRDYNPDIEIGIKTVPWKESDFDNAISHVVGQDVARLARYVDFIAPMTYSHMVKQPPQWIDEVVQEVSEKSGKRVFPGVQLAQTYRDEPVQSDELNAMISYAAQKPAAGVLIFHYDTLVDNTHRFERIKNAGK